ncbi:FecR family protein [Gelidibacter maritimus]|uniref:DUF4974 domain-containing protein n=1 Tax=Gelidibacter maritimus TaxID=2761487 RepID=A0A7W2M4Y6_9FLAO|nr:FecR family protein [Gelidibacter maritimus]MBA6152812.1 DUF4974 domain-containing protein [Gelidibacter maritimus]
MNNQKINKEFKNLIEKYLDGEISIEELKKLVSYYESFQKSNEWVEELGSESELKNKILSNILETIQEETPKAKLVPFYKKPIFKYTVAASIALLMALNFVFTKPDSVKIEPTLVESKDIVIGTDKATLTLADGSQVVLESGESYKTANANSNGKEIIYDAGANASSEVQYNYLTIPRGGQFFIKLSDGTQVWLNSESQLKYPVHFVSGKTREVELIYGEAYFDVSPSVHHQGAKFTVKNESQNINVIGTEFNVKAYKSENQIVTTLVEGKVEIAKEKDRVLLNPNQQSVLDMQNDKIAVKEADVAQEISWLKGLYTFDEASLADIMRTLSRWYDFDVDFKNTEKQNYVFTGVLERSKSIQDILKNLEATGEVQFNIENKMITIE